MVELLGGAHRVTGRLHKGESNPQKGKGPGAGIRPSSLRLDGLCFSAGRLIIPTHSAELHVTSVP